MPRLPYDVDMKMEGWIFDGPSQNVVEEYEVDGMAGVPGQKGYVDYVLFGRNGLPLAVVEAKKTSRDPNVGRKQRCCMRTVWKDGLAVAP